MVREGIVLGHISSEREIEVDKAKVDLISNLPLSTSVKQIYSFLGHVGFYRRFIKNFSTIAHPLTQLLAKDTPFHLTDSCLKAFHSLKAALTQAPILQSPDWSLLFEIMCNASNYAIGVVLGQRMDKKPVVIYYANRTLTDALIHFTTMEKELLTIVFTLDKF